MTQTYGQAHQKKIFYCHVGLGGEGDKYICPFYLQITNHQFYSFYK